MGRRKGTPIKWRGETTTTTTSHDNYNNNNNNDDDERPDHVVLWNNDRREGMVEPSTFLQRRGQSQTHTTSHDSPRQADHDTHKVPSSYIVGLSKAPAPSWRVAVTPKTRRKQSFSRNVTVPCSCVEPWSAVGMMETEQHTTTTTEVEISSAAACRDGDDMAWEIRILTPDTSSLALELFAGPEKKEWPLKVYQLHNCSIHLSGTAGSIMTSRTIVRTGAGARCLLEHCQSMCERSSDDKVDMSPIAEAIEDRTLSVDCCTTKEQPNVVQVSVRLLERAFTVCKASKLPHSSRRRQRASKAFRPVLILQSALACLFPGTVIADVVHPLQSRGPITSKMIYDLVDNAKLHEYERNVGYDSKRMVVPGLVPTLRPYQEAAVKWMLRRERGQEPMDLEWELAWVVISPPTSVFNDATASSRAFTGEVLSIPDWKRRNDNSLKEAGLHYCPFFGFFATSSSEAYNETLDSFVKSGEGVEWESPLGGILADSMGLGKTVEVLACILANRLVLSDKKDHSAESHAKSELKEETKVGGGDAMQNPSDDEFEFDDDMSVDSAKGSGSPEGIHLATWVDTFGACACGVSDTFKGCLSLVLCQSCRMPMHGVCAGFESLEQLTALTRSEVVVGTYTFRVCSADRCPSCTFNYVHESGNLIPSRATLIITPASIVSQWQRELRRHADPSMNLRIVVYPGIRELCSHGNRTGSSHLIHPRLLAEADIVLMTFDALMGDLGHSDDNPFVQRAAGLRLRTAKRYGVTPSPLLSVRWWRVTLDEAQRVETPTAISARMAQKLVCHHRWCVSGTPIGRGKLDDLYGLFLFLRIGPVCSKDWFQRCLREDYSGVVDRIRHLLSFAIWRSTKSSDSVREQMQVPDQTERKVLLKFSSIERHFYARQLEETLGVYHDVSHSKKKRKSADDLLSSHMHKLRAACCHPQVGSSGIGRPKKKRRNQSYMHHNAHTVGVSSGVLSMEQILDKLVDDAKTKCEESQRTAVMHTNAIASLLYLKTEAREFGVRFSETDRNLLEQSSNTYVEALRLTDSNSTPTAVVGDSILLGSSGFQSNRQVVRDGKARLVWKIRGPSDHDSPARLNPVWSRVDFEDAPKRVIELKIRPLHKLSNMKESIGVESVKLVWPGRIVFQASNAALGGEFVDIATCRLERSAWRNRGENDWLTLGGFVTNKSKCWRIVLKDFEGPVREDGSQYEASVAYGVGIDVQLLEADIAADSLQRLHVLHNASLVMTSLLQHPESDEGSISFMTDTDMNAMIGWMDREAGKIESLYMDMPKSVHIQSQRQLTTVAEERTKVEQDLFNLLPQEKRPNSHRQCRDCFDDQWWDDLLSIYALYGAPQEHRSLCEAVKRDLHDFVNNTEEGRRLGSHNGSVSKRSSLAFHDFSGVNGLRTVLGFRFRDFRYEAGPGSHASLIQSIQRLSATPTIDEVFENSHCRKCRKDWNQKGPECRHCKLETTLEDTVEVDQVMITIFRSLSKFGRETKGSQRLLSARIEAKIGARADKFFAALSTMEREVRAARVAWRSHFDLLSHIDELNQCKRSMRLASKDEDYSKLTTDEQRSIVLAADVGARHMDHGAKQAMALAELRRNKDTLRFLKNQTKDRIAESEEEPDGASDDTSNQCIVCLSSFGGECAVLSCGHRFHYSPCLEKLVARNGSHSLIRCPLRCTVTTKRGDVMIATNKRRDDGSTISRDVQGSWGTKVTRLVADVMDVADLGEKGIVFSQWEDMLEVVEHALAANGVTYIRANSLSKLGESVGAFRSSDCVVLLMNVRNGAEGLTLVEATHVFMIEPLLNCGLDSQAISRIHRIGQTSKTYVHRYLVDDTIEIKIDAMRVERQAEQLEDALHESRRKHDVSAGGIDGGFSHEQLKDLLK